MQSEFKVFHCGPYYKIGEIFAVITGEQFDGGLITTEWYYLVVADTKEYANSFKISASFFNAIEDFWKSETLINLKNAIFYKEMVPVMDKISYYRLNQDISFNEIDNVSLFTLKTEHEGFVHFIEKTTVCRKLKEYIKMLKSTKIERTNLDYKRFK